MSTPDESTPTASPQRDAVATTSLQAAWQAVSPDYYGGAEDDCNAAFSNVVNRYIHSPSRVVALPSDHIGQLNPLGRIWCDGECAEEPQANLGPPIEFDPQEHTALLVNFERDVMDDAGSFAKWTLLQMAPKVAAEYFGRVGEIRSRKVAREYIESVLPYVEAHVDSASYKEFVHYLKSTVPPAGVAQQHREVMEDLSLPIERYGTAYAVSHVLRGRSYATQLAGRGILYTPHWTRKSVSLIRGRDEESTAQEHHRHENPWGLILLRNFKERHLKPDYTTLDRVLKTIRDQVQEDGVRQHPRLLSKEPKEVITSMIRILDKAGMPPIPKNEKDYIDFLTAAGQMLGSGATVTGLFSALAGFVLVAAFTAIQLGSRTKALRKLEARAELLFSFDRFKRRYTVLGIID